LRGKLAGGRVLWGDRGNGVSAAVFADIYRGSPFMWRFVGAFAIRRGVVTTSSKVTRSLRLQLA
jgi:hypothetical protein